MSANQTIPFQHRIIDPEGPTNPHIKVAGDINGDGFTDVVVASSNGGPLVWYAAPNWTKHVIAPSGKWSTDAKLIDMDGDGDVDILISEWYTHNRLEWYENPRPSGDAATQPWKHHIIGPPRAHDIEVGDIDGDGRLEIVTRTQGADGDKFVVRKQEGSVWNQRVIPCPAGEGLAIGDVNNNGRLDVVIGGRWYEAPEDVLRGEWREHIFAAWPEDAVVQVADMNMDGRLDVVLTRSEGPHRISWFEVPPNPITDEWTEHLIGDSIDFAHSLVICDIDNDGHLDIVTAEMHQSHRKRVMVYRNAGDAITWEQQVIATTGSHKICVADTDGTGNLDIVGANWSGDYQPIEMWGNLFVKNANFQD